MRGRKPKPTVLKDLHGSEEPRNLLEPIPVGDLSDDPTECPAHFNADQRDAWEYAVRHSPPGMLKRIDVSVLAVWVVSYCLHARATRELQGRGLLIRQGPQIIPSPMLGILNRQAAVMMRAAELLGFTPVSRPKILAGGTSAGESLARPTLRGRDAPEQSIEDYLASAPRTALH